MLSQKLARQTLNLQMKLNWEVLQTPKTARCKQYVKNEIAIKKKSKYIQKKEFAADNSVSERMSEKCWGEKRTGAERGWLQA